MRTMFKLLSVLSLSLFITSFTYKAKSKVIVFVGAHPDDESAISDVLAMHARLGHKVHVIIATDGKDGTRVTKIPAGDSLGNVRKQESICACKTLGIEPPIFLSVERLDTRIGVGNYFKALKQLLVSLKEKINNLKPDVIITFGPDGDTHHAEHIVIGGAVTELLLMEGWAEKYPLYYVSWTKKQGETFDLGYVHEKYFNVRINYTQADEDKALESMKCYVTQFTPDELKEDHAKKIKDTDNTLHFRRFMWKSGLKNGFK